jgi:hypothetical protein
MYRWVALSFFAACATVSSAAAQDNGSLPAIHVEAGQVLIPTAVLAKITISEFSYISNFAVFWDEYRNVSHLTARDFHLFVDGKEQKIDSANLASVPRRLYRDNSGIENKATHRPNGTWTNLDNLDHRIVNPPDYSGPVSESQSTPFYRIAYRPSSFLNGSCHNIRIAIGPQNDSRSKRIPVAIDEYQRTYMKVVPRKNLVLRFPAQYCNMEDAATDPLYKTPPSEKLEGVAAEGSAKEAGFFLSAFERLDESQQSRIHVALDFPALSGQTGIPSFQVSLLGMYLFSALWPGPIARVLA